MASIDDLKAIYGTSSAEDALMRVHKESGIPLEDIAREVGYKTSGKWGNRLGASIDSYQANLQGLGEAVTGSDTLRRWRQENEASAEAQRGIARSQGAIQSYKDIGGVGDFLDYAGGLAIDSAPYLGEAVVGGLGVRALSGGLRAASAAGRAGNATADAVRAGQAAEAALGRRSMVGGVVASYPSAVGDILSNQREAGDGNTMDLPAALAGGVPYAALNAFGLEGMAARGTLGRGARYLDDMAGARGTAARVGTSVARTGLAEGLGETGQEMVNQRFGRMVTNPGEEMFSPGAMDRYAESFVGGAVLGGLGAAPGGGRRSEAYTQQQAVADAQAREERQRIADAVAVQKQDLLSQPLQLGYDPNALEPYVFPDGSQASSADMRGYRAAGLTPVDVMTGLNRFEAPRLDWNGDVVGTEGRVGEAREVGSFDPTPIPVAQYGGSGYAMPDGIGPTEQVSRDMGLPLSDVRGAVFDVGRRPAAVAGQPVSPAAVNQNLGVDGPPSRAARSERQADVQAAISEPGQRYIDENGLEVVGDRLRDNERQLGILQQIQDKVRASKEMQARAATALGGKPTPKAVELFGQLEAMHNAGTITDDEFSTNAAPLSDNKYGIVQKFIGSKTNANPGSGPGTAGAAPGRVPQPGGSGGAVAPVAGARAASPNPAGTPASGGASSGVELPVVNADGGAAPELKPSYAPREIGAGRDLTAQELAVAGKREIPYSDFGDNTEVRTESDEDVAFRRSFESRFRAAEPTDRELLGRWMGVDLAENHPDPDGVDGAPTEGLTSSDGYGEDLPQETLESIGASFGISKVAAHKRVKAALKRLGADQDIQPNVLRERLGLQVAGATAGDIERVTDAEAETQNGTRGTRKMRPASLEGEVAAAEADTDEEASARATTGNLAFGEDARNDDTADGPTVDGDDEIERARDARESAEAVAMLGLDKILERDFKSGRVIESDIAESKFAYEENRPRNAPLWGRMNDLDRATWVRHYARLRLEGSPDVLETKRKLYGQDGVAGSGRSGRSGPQTDTGAAAETPGGTGGTAVNAVAETGSGAAGGNLQEVPGAGPAERGPAPAVVVKKKRSIDREAAAADAELRKSAARLPGPRSDSVIREARLKNPDSGVNVLDATAFSTVRNAKALIAKYVELGKDEQLKELARTLSRSSVLGSVRVEWVKSGDRPPVEVVQSFNDGSGALAALSTEGVTLYFRTDLDGAFREDVVVHEVLHAMTEAALNRNPALRGELSSLASTIGAALTERAGFSHNAKKDTLRDFWRGAVGKESGELLAYALTSPAYREALSDFAADGRPFSAYRTQSQRDALRQGPAPAQPNAQLPTPLTLWQRMVDTFRRVFGLPPVHSRAFADALNAYVDSQEAYRRDTEESARLMPLRARLDEALRKLTADTEAKGVALPDGDAGAARAAMESVNDALDKAPAPVRNAASTVAESMKKLGLGALTNFQIAEQFADKFKLPALKQRAAHVMAMVQRRNALASQVDDVAKQWDALPAATKTQLNQLMQDATLAETHPDVAFNDEKNSHLGANDRAKYEQLKSRYNALPEPARAVYQRAKAVLDEQWDTRAKGYERMVDSWAAERGKAAMESGVASEERMANIEAEARAMRSKFRQQLGKLKGPYFPLMRFGSYIAVAESQALKVAEDSLSGLSGKALADARERVAEMRRDEKHYIVSAFDTNAQALEAVKRFRSQGMESRISVTDPTAGRMSREASTMMRQFQDGLREQWSSGQMDGESLDAAIKAATDVYMANLPEMHALKRQAERRGIAGASVDMLRAFAAAGRQGAFQASRMEFADELSADMADMRRQAKDAMARTDSPMPGHVANEMLKRQALDMTYTETPVQDAITTLGYTYYLGASPAFLVMNLMQPGMVSVPVLAGKHGLVRSAAAMKRGYADALTLLKGARMKNGKWDFWEAINPDSLKDSGDRLALRKLLQSGVIDEGMQHELNMYANDSSRAMARLSRGIGWASQQVELVNRISTAMAAYRLAMADGQSMDQALDYARSVTIKTQMDYSSESTARLMREGGGIPFAKVIFQFRRFQQGMLYLLGDNIKKLASEADRAQAAKTLGLMMLTSGMAAGAMGLPFMGVALAAAGIGDDEDDPSPEVRLRNYLTDITGSAETATVIAKGLPALFGVDISKRVGMGDVASPFPMARLDEAKNTREGAKELLFSAAGPGVGMMTSWAEGLQAFAAGDFQKGIEKTTPKMFADLSRAVRFGADGMTDSKGNPVPVPLDGADVLLRGLGFSSTTESNYYEGTKAIRDAQKGANDVKGDIRQKYMKSLRTGDFEAVREKITAWNAKHPDDRITFQDESRWRKDAQRAPKEYGATGVRVDKAAKPYSEVARFAGV